MASEIRRDPVIGNFRPSIMEREKAKREKKSARQRREGQSEAHRKLIRLLPCCVSGTRPPNDGHHLKSGPAGSERGIGMRATDKWLVPLRRTKHQELEKLSARREMGWFQEHGIEDVVELAAALWRNTGDLERMRKVLAAHMGK